MAEEINLMLDEMIDDLNWLIELGLRCARWTDLEQVRELKKKYFKE